MILNHYSVIILNSFHFIYGKNGAFIFGVDFKIKTKGYYIMYIIIANRF